MEDFTPIDFPEANNKVAEHQKQYRTLPAYIDDSTEDTPMVVCWKVSWWARLRILFTGEVWQTSRIFGRPVQPILLSTHKRNHIRDDMVTTDIDGCMECGEAHKDIQLIPLPEPVEGFTHVGNCPSNDKPILHRVEAN